MASEFLRDVPVASPDQQEIWGSDAIAAMLRALDIPYLALNPGASYRGLHDSIVNYLGNTRPQMLLCLHEESAVAIAHGYARVAGRMMGVVLHSNVGLMHGTMAIFNAWCDRVPMLILGATGPWDAAKRRPWIDWIHTSSDQGALVRDYTKWDNQPASVPAALRGAAARGADRRHRAARPDLRQPRRRAAGSEDRPAAARCRTWRASRPGTAFCLRKKSIAAGRAAAFGGEEPGHPRRPRLAAAESDWKARVALAEKLHAQVITDIKTRRRIPDRSSAARRRRRRRSSATTARSCCATPTSCCRSTGSIPPAR